MPISTNELIQRIRRIVPELAIDRFERNQEGTLNDIMIVNNNLVFRFAKTEAYARILVAETRILDFLRPQLDISIPDPIYVGSDCMVYPLLTGKPLLRKELMSLGRRAQHQIAEQLGSSLSQLHSLDASKFGKDIPITHAQIT